MVRTDQQPRGGYYYWLPQCGCWFPGHDEHQRAQKNFLPLLNLTSHTTILASSTRTTLRQTFTNSDPKHLEEVCYTFPLFDGVSVVEFRCTVGSKTIVGMVKEKQQARTEYKEAVAQGKSASLLEQLADNSDVFTTKIGHIPANTTVQIDITYLGELIHDAQLDGLRFTIPSKLAPRYGENSFDAAQVLNTLSLKASGISITVDVGLDDNSAVTQIQSPSHPLTVIMGRTSSMKEDIFQSNNASASLALETTSLDKDFVFVLSSKEQGTPKAMLETHPTLAGRRAVMATLVPKFNLPNIVPEIVFVVDRSGSMGGKIKTLVEAMKVFLKSLPVNGIKFNICSFGSHYSFLFQQSKMYDQTTLDQALKNVASFDANFGGTEMLAPFRATYEQRFSDLPLEIMLLTDGQIWDQNALFDFINQQKNARVFSIGIGTGASTALVEGIARAGGGFAQFVAENEKMDKKIVRMLKGALTPHISDYTVEVEYEAVSDGFEMVESSNSTKASSTSIASGTKQPISLFDPTAEEQSTNPPGGRYDALPTVPTPSVIQAPHKISALYPFNRTTVYLLLDQSSSTNPISLKLKGTSDAGPLELKIPIQDIGTGVTIHQLAAKKTAHELEQGRGWLTTSKTADEMPLKSSNEGRWDLMVERECVRLGCEYGVAGKFTSFVAVEKSQDGSEHRHDDVYQTAPYDAQADMLRARSIRGGGGPPPGSGGLFGGVNPRPVAMMAMRAAPSGPQSSSSAFGFSQAAVSAPPPPMATSLFGAPTGSHQSASFDQASSYAPSTAAYTMSSGLFGATATQPHDSSSLSGSATASSYATPTAPPPKTSGLFGAPASGMKMMRQRMAQPFARSSKKKSRSAFLKASSDDDDSEGDFAGDDDKVTVKPVSTMTTIEKMYKVIEGQKFDGSWTGEDDLWELLGVTQREVSEKFVYSDQKDRVLIATVAAVAWLQFRVSSEEEVWEMVVEKAKAWLGTQGASFDVEEALDALKSCF